MQTFASLGKRYGPIYRWLAMLAVTSAAFVTVLSSTIVNVVIVQVMEAFGMGLEQAQWLSSGFLAANTVCLLFSAPLVEKFGIRKTMLASLALFVIGSLLGAVAMSDMVVILARLIQGAASGLIQPLSFMVIAPVFPIERRGLAMGIYGVGMLLGPTLGPVVAGLTLEYFTWEYTFWLQVPLALAALALCYPLLPDRDHARPSVFDGPSAAMLTVGIFALLLGVSDAQAANRGYGHPIELFLLSAAVLGWFVVRQFRLPYPLVDLRLLRYSRFVSATLIAFVLGVGLHGTSVLIPLFLQTVLGASAMHSGLVLLPAGLAMALFSPFAGHLSDRFAPRYVIWAGLLLVIVSSFAQSHISRVITLATLAVWVTLGRVGLAVIFPALYGSSLKAVPLSSINQAAGIINVSRQLGGAIGVAVLMFVYERASMTHYNALVDAFSVDGASGMLSDAQVFASSSATQNDQYAQTIARTLRGNAATSAFRDAFFVIALLSAVFVPLAWFSGGKEALVQRTARD